MLVKLPRFPLLQAVVIAVPNLLALATNEPIPPLTVFVIFAVKSLIFKFVNWFNPLVKLLTAPDVIDLISKLAKLLGAFKNFVIVV